VQVVDFGLAKVVKRRYRNITETYTMTAGVGSLRYMAPECALNRPYNEMVSEATPAGWCRHCHTFVRWRAQRSTSGWRRPMCRCQVVTPGAVVNV
jgi:serine/threonine protein kinase